jgi:1-aminocyclopropane-1-carboxylate deaminase
MDLELSLPSKVNRLELPLFDAHGIKVAIKRDDQIHPVISGNKWRKLNLNIAKCQQEKYNGILTFGGAYSNHLVATAHAAQIFSLKSIGIVRGDELKIDSNYSLESCHKAGMQLIFTGREEYGLRAEKYYEEELRRRHGNYMVVPEGGANYLGALGCLEILNELNEDYDHIFLAGGTGTTAAGLLFGNTSSKIQLVPALKGGDFLRENIRMLLQDTGLSSEEINAALYRLIIHTDYHFGGFAKSSKEVLNFINHFYNETGIPLDQVYTAKMMYGFMDLIKKGEFLPDSSVLILHTGGLQGLQTVARELSFL